LKTFGQLNAMYAASYNNWSIPINSGWTGCNYSCAWYDGVIGRDIKQIAGMSSLISNTSGWPKGFICPNAPLATLLNSSLQLFNIARSYAMNGVSQSPGTTTWGKDPRGWRMSQLKKPSVTINFIDSIDYAATIERSYFDQYYGIRGEYYDRPGNYTSVTAYRHSCAANICFGDGHSANVNFIFVQGDRSLWFPY